jgi:hypothetical protein
LNFELRTPAHHMSFEFLVFSFEFPPAHPGKGKDGRHICRPYISFPGHRAEAGTCARHRREADGQKGRPGRGSAIDHLMATVRLKPQLVTA